MSRAQSQIVGDRADLTNDRASRFGRQIGVMLLVAAIVFLAALLGNLTRPLGFLATFWPANAILLGLMVRNPCLASFLGWVGAFVGYICADLITRGTFGITLWLSGANLLGALVGYALFRLLPKGDRRLARPQSVLSLFAICCVAAMVAALAGGGVAKLLFERDFLTGFEFWFVTELVNTLAILPAILTFPTLRQIKANRVARAKVGQRITLWKAVPLGALIVSVGIAILVDGPGAIAFPVPALLWCALTYRMCSTALITMCLCIWMLVAMSSGIVQLSFSQDDLASLSSIRLGLALIALGPLTAASINTSRIALFERLERLVDHDSLTGVLSRRAFLARAERLLARQNMNQKSIAVLMLDIDHFKHVNDQLGHATGDAVLVAFTRTVVQSLRPEDLIGRVGGEEFAVVMRDMSDAAAVHTAERIRAAVEAARQGFKLGASVTVSIGVKVSAHSTAETFEGLLASADRALYRAKNEGRNQVVLDATAQSG